MIDLANYSKLKNFSFIKMETTKHFIRNLQNILKVCQEYDIDIIHSHNRSTSIYPQFVKMRMRIPFVWTIHANNIPSDFIHKKLTFTGDSVIAVSDELKDFLIEKLDVKSERINVIRNGVDEKKYFHLREDEIYTLKDNWDISCNEKVIADILTNEDNYSEMIKRANEYVLENCTIQAMGKAIREQYAEVVKNNE